MTHRAGARRVYLALTSGALMVFAFPPLGHWFLGWVALIPLLLTLDGVRPRTAFRLGFLAGYAGYAFLLYWLIHMFGWLAPVLWGAVALVVGLWAWLWTLLGRDRPGWYRLLLAPLLWVALEYARCEGHRIGFPMLALGYTQVFPSPCLQAADIVGVYGISFLIVLCAAAVQITVARGFRTGEGAACWTAVLVVMVLLGSRGLALNRESPDVPTTDDAFVAGIVQDETDTIRDKVELSRTDELVDGKPALVVWPEYSCTRCVMAEDLTRRAMLATARGLGSHLVVGIPTPAGPRVRNSAVVLGPDGSELGWYAKHRPVPWIESGVEPGGELNTIPTAVGRLGIAMGYDAAFPSIPRGLVANGAELLVVPAHDKLIWGMMLKAEHAGAASMRAVETRRFLVRATSSGTSAIYDPFGQSVVISRVAGPMVAWGWVRPVTVQTFYVRHGWRLPQVCGLLVVAAIGHYVAASLWARRRRAGREPENDS